MPATSRSGDRLMRRSLRLAHRFPLEVDDDEVLAGVQHLAEVIIAVVTHAQPGRLRLHHRAEALEHFVLQFQQLLGLLARRPGQIAEALPQLLEGPALEVAHRLVDATLIEGRERLRGEGRVFGVGGQGQVHLGRPSRR